MTETVQVLLLFVGVLVSVLVGLLVSQLSGIRSDLKAALEQMQAIDKRLVKLEAEHATNLCAFKGAVNG